MEIGSKEYLDTVMQEIEGIKKYATKEQIEKLNLDTFEPEGISTCIYGQMTGSCFSPQTTALIKQINIPLYVTDIVDGYDRKDNSKIEVGVPREAVNNDSTDSFTLLEHFISKYRSNNRNILLYLKGEIPELVLVTE